MIRYQWYRSTCRLPFCRVRSEDVVKTSFISQVSKLILHLTSQEQFLVTRQDQDIAHECTMSPKVDDDIVQVTSATDGNVDDLEKKDAREAHEVFKKSAEGVDFRTVSWYVYKAHCVPVEILRCGALKQCGEIFTYVPHKQME